MIRSCIECGTLITRGSRCKAHTYRTGSTPQWRVIRSRILERDNNRCTWITDGQRCRATLDLHVDHIIPLVKGGQDVDTNLRTLCRPCHEQRHARRVTR